MPSGCDVAARPTRRAWTAANSGNAHARYCYFHLAIILSAMLAYPPVRFGVMPPPSSSEGSTAYLSGSCSLNENNVPPCPCPGISSCIFSINNLGCLAAHSSRRLGNNDRHRGAALGVTRCQTQAVQAVVLADRVRPVSRARRYYFQPSPTDPPTGSFGKRRFYDDQRISQG